MAIYLTWTTCRPQMAMCHVMGWDPATPRATATLATLESLFAVISIATSSAPPIESHYSNSSSAFSAALLCCCCCSYRLLYYTVTIEAKMIDTNPHFAAGSLVYVGAALLACMTYPLPACVRTSTHSYRICITTLPTLSYMQTYLYTCRFNFIHGCWQPHAHIQIHTFQCRPLRYYTTTQEPRTHAHAAPPYLAAWMSGPFAYISFPQTLGAGVNLEPLCVPYLKEGQALLTNIA